MGIWKESDLSWDGPLPNPWTAQKDLSIQDHVNIQETRTDLNRVLWKFFNRFDLLLYAHHAHRSIFGQKAPALGY